MNIARSTVKCSSESEYESNIDISNTGSISIDPVDLLRSEEVSNQLDKLVEFEKQLLEE